MRKFESIPEGYPLAKPGVYMLIHRDSDKRYIGISANVRRRLREHATGGSPRKLRHAIEKYGASAFTAVPLYYSLDDRTDHLPMIEADLILAYSSYAGGGYNVKLADGGVGPYGPEFGQLIAAHHAVPENKRRMVEAMLRAINTPEVRAKISAGALAKWADPEVRANMIAGITKSRNLPERACKYTGPEASLRNSRIAQQAMANPEVREKIGAGNKAAWARPDRRELGGKAAKAVWESLETRAKHTAARIERWSDPMKRAALSEMMAGVRWINDGAKCSRIGPNEPLPEGWNFGRLGKLTKGLVWITDGVKSRRVPPETELSDGWKLGNASKGKPKPRRSSIVVVLGE